MACVNATPARRNARPSPAEYTASSTAPRTTELVVGQREDRREHDADTRRRAHRERCPEQHGGASPPGPRDEAGREEALRPRQQADEREPEDDEHEAGELGLPVEGQHAADRGRPRAQDHEDDGEAGDERQAPQRDAACGTRLAEAIGLDRRHRREVAGHERQDARA